MKKICKDLSEEYQALDEIVAKLDEKGWNKVTTFYNWRIRDEISHIAFFDGTARLAATDAPGFAKHIEEILSDLVAFDKQPLNEGNKLTTSELMEWWRRERSQLVAALEPLSPKTRIPWYGPPMSALSFATARIMETWAHGQDIVDTLGISRKPTMRLSHIAHLGVKTMGWSFSNRNMDVPQEPVYVALKSPDGDMWTWGTEDAQNSVSGTAEDFCLIVTQRRHFKDTNINIVGDVAEKWMIHAQAFAGPPANGPAPGSFPKKNK